MSSIMRRRSGLTVLVSLMESSILSEVDDTSILRTGLPTPLWPSSQLATGLSPLAPRSGLERSDFVHWHRREGCLSWRIGQLAGVKLTLPSNCRISAVDPKQSLRPHEVDLRAARQVRKSPHISDLFLHGWVLS